MNNNTPLAESVYKTLQRSYTEPFFIQSNFAREFSQEVSALASAGMITTYLPEKKNYGKIWRITLKGLTRLIAEAS